MVTDQQVLLLRRRIMEGKTQQASVATAGMSARSARRWQRGPLPSVDKVVLALPAPSGDAGATRRGWQFWRR